MGKAGFLLTTLGFLAGAFLASLDPRIINWAAYLPAIAVGVVTWQETSDLGRLAEAPGLGESLDASVSLARRALADRSTELALRAQRPEEDLAHGAERVGHGQDERQDAQGRHGDRERGLEHLRRDLSVRVHRLYVDYRSTAHRLRQFRYGEVADDLQAVRTLLQRFNPAMSMSPLSKARSTWGFSSTGSSF